MDRILLTSGIMDVQSQSEVKSKKFKETELILKVGDISKYNLRCNRNISEKMTKKDFVYDMRRPLQGTKKLEGHKQRTHVLPIQLRRKEYPKAIMTQYSIIPKNGEIGGGGDAAMLPTRRALNFECNFCHEPIATLFSLSTHVKYHCQRYCKKCYWILEKGETMDTHVEKAHQLGRK